MSLILPCVSDPSCPFSAEHQRELPDTITIGATYWSSSLRSWFSLREIGKNACYPNVTSVIFADEDRNIDRLNVIMGPVNFPDAQTFQRSNLTEAIRIADRRGGFLPSGSSKLMI